MENIPDDMWLTKEVRDLRKRTPASPVDLEIYSLKCWGCKRSRPPAEPALKLQIARATTAHETDNISEESLGCSGNSPKSGGEGACLD